MTAMELTPQLFSSPGERAGLALIATAGLASAVSTAGLLTYIMWSVFMTQLTKSFRSVPRGVRAFARSTLGCYLISLLCCDFCQGVAFTLNYHWAVTGSMSDGTLCSIQGAVSQLGDLGAAIWSMAIALHTFWVLFLVRKPHRLATPVILLFGWALLIILPIVGPLVIEDSKRGSFYSLSGAWCWVGEKYEAARLAYLYGWIFVALASSIVTYTLIYLRFSNIITFDEDGKVKVALSRSKFETAPSFSKSQSGSSTSRHTASSLPGCFDWAKDARDLSGAASVTSNSTNHVSKDSQSHGVSEHLRRVARRLMWYPILYALVVLPASVCRMGVLGGWEPPFGLFVFAGVCFGGSGITNSILFLMTRHSFIKQVMKTKNATRVHVTTHRVTVREDSAGVEQDVELDDFKLINNGVLSTVTKSIKYDPNIDESPMHSNGVTNRVSVTNYCGDPGSPYEQEEENRAGFHVTVLGKPH